MSFSARFTPSARVLIVHDCFRFYSRCSPFPRLPPAGPRGTRSAALESTDLDGLLADNLEVRIDETDAETSVDSLLRVYGDPGQLRQLFQNLLDNAITYSGDGAPRISVFDENTGSIWRGSVHDRGLGSTRATRIASFGCSIDSTVARSTTAPVSDSRSVSESPSATASGRTA